MGLSYRATPATSQSSGGVSSFSVSKQAGTAAGDWIFIHLFGAGSGSVACTGFTVTQDPNDYGAFLYRLADGTEGASWSITGLGGNSVAVVIATVAGGAGALDATVVAPTSSSNSTSLAVASITVGTAGDWVLWFAGNDDGYSNVSYAITPPSGYTSRATNGAQTSNPAMMVADNQSASSGATGAKTGTASTATYWSGVMVALKPAPTGVYEVASDVISGYSGTTAAAKAIGNTLFYCVYSFGSASASVTSVQYNGVTYTNGDASGTQQVFSLQGTETGDMFCAIWALPSISASSSSVGATMAGGASAPTDGLHVIEVGGLGARPVLSAAVPGGAHGNAATASMGPSSALGSVPAIVLAACASYFGFTSGGPSSGGWTNVAGASDYCVTSYQTPASAGSTYSWSLGMANAGDGWALGMIFAVPPPPARLLAAVPPAALVRSAVY